MLTSLSRKIANFLRYPLARHPDTAVAAVNAPAFIAGDGARIYSLEAFRSHRVPHPSPRRAA